MSKVTAFTLSTLRNEEILGMSLEIAEKPINVKSVADSAQGKAFLDAIPAYASALDLEKTLTYKDLVQADAAVDQAITGLRMHLQALLGYPDDDTREAARQIWNAIDQYGSPTQLNFQEEYAIVARMLEMLEAIDSVIFVKATVAAWLPTLRTHYDAFMSMMKSYDAERAAVQPGAVKNARQALIDVYRDLVDTLNAMQINSKSGAFDLIAQHLNELIDANHSAMKAKKTAKKGGKETEGTFVKYEE